MKTRVKCGVLPPLQKILFILQFILLIILAYQVFSFLTHNDSKNFTYEPIRRDKPENYQKLIDRALLQIKKRDLERHKKKKLDGTVEERQRNKQLQKNTPTQAPVKATPPPVKTAEPTQPVLNKEPMKYAKKGLEKPLVVPKYCEKYLQEIKYDEEERKQQYLAYFLFKKNIQEAASVTAFEECLVSSWCKSWEEEIKKDRETRKAGSKLFYYSFTKDGFSQDGQDRWLDDRVFQSKRDGYFVDVGAFDGISGSNSYYFEMCRGWKGISFEAHPYSVEQLRKVRHSDKSVIVPECVAEFKGPSNFTLASTLSGLPQHFHPQHLARIQRETTNLKNITVNCHKLADVLASHSVHHVDYLSLDVEGTESHILHSLTDAVSSGQLQIDVVTVENTYFVDIVSEWMTKHNFFLVRSIGADNVYLHSNVLKSLPGGLPAII